MQPTSLADRVNFAGRTLNPDIGFKPQVSSFQETRNNDIVTALSVAGFKDIVTPDENELLYVNSVFQSKGFHQIDSVTSEMVDNIAKQEFSDLNNKLKQFTGSMQGVKTAGLFLLIDELSKDIEDTNLEGVWEKAVNAKPTVLARIMSLFDRSAKKKSISQQLQSLGIVLGEKSGNLNARLTKIEQELETKKREQYDSVIMLEKAFDVYYKSFLQLRRQFALIVYLEHTYKSQLEQFYASNSENTDLVINKKMQDYERIFADIQNKRLLLHKTLLQLPVTATQSNNLIGVCKTLIKEVDNTVMVSLPNIRSSLVNVSAAIVAQQAMLTTDSTQKLDENLAKLSSKVTADLTVKAATLAADSRLREANAIAGLVNDLKDLKGRVDAAKAESQQKIDSATNVLTSATTELKQILGNG